VALDPTDISIMIGNNHIRLNRVNSTNKYATDMIAKSKPIEGTVISASFQYEGRGQIGRFWESEAGKNISCSTILLPTFLEASQQFQLNIAVSLAVHDFVDHFIDSEEVRIKWPNDIYVGDKKIAGILIQNTLLGKTISTSVWGTGININQVLFSEDVPNPTSLALENMKDMEIDTCMLWLFRFLTKRYLQLKAGHLESMRSEYHELLYRRDVWAGFMDSEDNRWTGKIIKVDDLGRLVILNTDEEEKVFGFREIRFVV